MTNQEIVKANRQAGRDKFSRRFLELRKRFLLTQVRACELAGMSRRGWQLVETGVSAPYGKTLERFLALESELEKQYGKKEKTCKK